MVDACVKLINEVGFPIAITVYLVYFLTRTMKDVLYSIAALHEEIHLLRNETKEKPRCSELNSK